jgi:hypothetical protein
MRSIGRFRSICSCSVLVLNDVLCDLTLWRYLLGGDGAWDHINTCPHHSANWTSAHEHVLRALDRICNDAGYATSSKRVLPSEGTRYANLEVRNTRVAGKTDVQECQAQEHH